MADLGRRLSLSRSVQASVDGLTRDLQQVGDLGDGVAAFAGLVALVT